MRACPQCTRRQVFEHVNKPHEAIGVLVRMLRPGGLLYWSVPFNERFHLVPGDFFRCVHPTMHATSPN